MSKGKRGYNNITAKEAMKEPITDSKTRNSIFGETGLTLLQEDAIEMILQRDVTDLTFKEIAEHLDVDTSTLWRWRQSKEFNDVLLEKTEEVQRNFLHEAYIGMRRILTDPNAKTHNKLKVIEMVLRNQGRMKDVTENTHEVETNNMEDLLDKLDNL